jgi:hypothetical protein
MLRWRDTLDSIASPWIKTCILIETSFNAQSLTRAYETDVASGEYQQLLLI